jgi:hypothetical protein
MPSLRLMQNDRGRLQNTSFWRRLARVLAQMLAGTSPLGVARIHAA